MPCATVARPSEYVVEETPWGSLTWFVNATQGGSLTLTVGRCAIRPGCANPRHHHPNCDEVLHVLQGEIVHAVGDAEIPMQAGDTISIPSALAHSARNTGACDAILLICFSSAKRETVGE